MLRRLKNYFITGLVVLLPIGLTVFILYRGFLLFDGILTELIHLLLFKVVGIEFFRDRSLPGIGLVALVFITILIGVLAKNFLGRRLIARGNRLVARIPLINKIYRAISQIISAIISGKRQLSESPVLFEYPKEGVYSIGFITQDTEGPVQELLKDDVVSIFLPTTPNPTSGYLLFVPKKSIYRLNMSAEEALKLVISGGTVTPEKLNP